MRVVGGSARGRQLKTPEGRAIRPSTDRIRESMFNLLGPGHLAEQVLDAFAGTGALGIEALSRGVAQATFTDADPKALRLVHENLARCKFAERARVRKADALDWLRAQAADFDLIFLDPPYGQGLVLSCLEIIGGSVMAEGARVVCECERGLELPEAQGCLALIKERLYGDTRVGIYEA